MRVDATITDALARWEMQGYADEDVLATFGIQKEKPASFEYCKNWIQSIQQRSTPAVGELYSPDPKGNEVYCVIAVAKHYADPELTIVVYFDMDDTECETAQYAMLDDFVRRQYLIAWQK